MSGAAGISAAKRRRAGSDFSKNQQSSGYVNHRTQHTTSRNGQVDLNNPNAILEIHDRLIHNHISNTNILTQKQDYCLSKLNEVVSENKALEAKNRMLSSNISKLDKRLKQLEQVEKLREGHVDDASVESDNDVPDTTKDLSDLSNVSFSVKEQ